MQGSSDSNMKESILKKVRRLMPERIKSRCRSVRAWLLSINLGSVGPFLMSPEEKIASASMSVIVAVHDALEDTKRCLNSLEISGGDAEVIIVDDGSRLQPVRDLLDEFCLRNDWKLVRHGKAVGHSRASEAGVAVSRRPYVCLLNSDTILTHRSWSGMLRAFGVSPQIAVVGPSTSHTATRQQVMRACYCRHHWSENQILCFAEKYVTKHRDEPVVDLPLVGGFAFFMRRDIWDKMGGFDKNLPDYGNEVEFCRRLTQDGFRVVWSKASYIHHLGARTYGQTLGIKAIRERCSEADSYIGKKWAQ